MADCAGVGIWLATELSARSGQSTKTNHPTGECHGTIFAELCEIDCYGCGKKGHQWRRCPELTQDMKDAVVAKLKEGTSTKDGTIKDAVANINVGRGKELQECIEGVTNISVQRADKASIQSADYQDMESQDGSEGEGEGEVICKQLFTTSKSRAGHALGGCNKSPLQLFLGLSISWCHCYFYCLGGKHLKKL